MKILICLATELEKRPVAERLQGWLEARDGSVHAKKYTIDFLVTGVGTMATVYHLASRQDITTYDLLLNVGIGGSFNPSFPVGSVVEVTVDRLADLGIEEKDGRFTDVFTAGLVPPDDFPFRQGLLINPDRYTDLPEARGITVNKVHGESGSISKIQALYQPDIESMEGAAFFYTALQRGVPFCQLRAISNVVESRDKTRWNIPLALYNLAGEVFRLLEKPGFLKK